MTGGAGRVFRRILATVVIVGVLVGAGFAYLNRQTIADHFAAQNFNAGEEVSALTDRLDLTDAGRRVFLASKPTLDASQNFNEQCADVEHTEGSHVLGCFAGGSIHLYKVTDERLAGIVEVTAAHELLHAVFSRLNADERADLASLLRSAYDALASSNPVLVERMSVYEGLSDDGFANELHSVLGTEVRELPVWLEDRYVHWFQDRGAIVDFFDTFHTVFGEIQARADALQVELSALRESIEARSAAYDAAVQQFNIEVSEFNRRNEAFEFSDRESEFWAIRNSLQSRSAQLQSDLAALQADIAQYEQMRLELEQLGAVNAELNEHLNSQLAPPAMP